MHRRITNLSTVLAVTVSGLVVAIVTAAGFLLGRHQHIRMLDAVRHSVRDEATLIRLALEHQMLENERDLIDKMVQSFGAREGIDRVMVLDRRGTLRFTSDPAMTGTTLSASSPTCSGCHEDPPERRTDSRVIEVEGGDVLRTVVPIRNRPACLGASCHQPGHRINGLLIVDASVRHLQSQMAADIRTIALGGGAVALLLLGLIAVVVRLVMLRRLRRFEAAARGIAAGDLSQRVPEAGTDTLGSLTREFNAVVESAATAVEEVGRQQRRLESILSSIDDGVVVLDRNLQVVTANDAFLRRMVPGFGSPHGRHCTAALGGACHAAGGCPALASFQSADRHTAVITRAGPDGTPRVEEIRTSPMSGDDGAVGYVVEVWRDITERRQTEARIAESHRLASLGLLASGFSHELNTPLGSVLTCVEGILREAESGNADAAEVVADYGRLARSELLRCRGITQQFLRLARSEDTSVDLVEVAPLLEAVARIVRPTGRERGVSVCVQADAPRLLARACEPELQQVLLNLMLNGLQACSRGGTVRVEVQGQGRRVVIRVTDDGKGIPDDDLPRIFEPFFSRRPGGTGLGLFISRNLVRAFGGELLVSSTLGVGTAFEVMLDGGDTQSAAEEAHG